MACGSDHHGLTNILLETQVLILATSPHLAKQEHEDARRRSCDQGCLLFLPASCLKGLSAFLDHLLDLYERDQLEDAFLLEV